MKGIILHGGSGTRLRPLTHTGPKQLIPIANKPVSQYALEALRETGIKEIAIILGSLGPEKVVEYYGDGCAFGVKITYLNQREPKGIAHAVGLAREFVGEDPFVVYLGDNILKGGIKNLTEEFRKSGHVAQVALCRVKNPGSFGVAEIQEGKIKRLIEKPKDPPSDLALVGVYFFRKPVFEQIERLKPSWRGELEITDAVQGLIDAGYDVDARLVEGWWKDTGRPEDVLEANQLVLAGIQGYNHGQIRDSAIVTGNVAIGEDTIIEESTRLRGPLIIGRGCRVGPNAYIGPYTSIGDNCQIRNAEIENTIIVGHSHIECQRRIVDSLIGRNTRIMDGARGLPSGVRFILGENTELSI